MFCALQNCKDAKSIMALAKSKGIAMSGEQAEKLYAMFQNEELTDEDLEKVTGGGNTCPCREALKNLFRNLPITEVVQQKEQIDIVHNY